MRTTVFNQDLITKLDSIRGAQSKVYSAKAVPNVVESMVSLNVATTKSSDLLLIFAVTNPAGVPDFFKRTFHDLGDFPINKEAEVLTSMPYLIDKLECRPAPAATLPGIGTL